MRTDIVENAASKTRADRNSTLAARPAECLEQRAIVAAPGPPVIPNLALPEFVLGQAQVRGERRALVDAVTGRVLSYRGLAVTVREVAAGFAARGVRPRDVLALCAPNSIAFAVSWFAALSVGASVTTVNPLSTGEEITRQLRQMSARCW